MIVEASKGILNPSFVTDMSFPADEELAMAEDTGTITSSLLTPTISSTEFDFSSRAELSSAQRTVSASQSSPCKPSPSVDLEEIEPYDPFKNLGRDLFIMFLVVIFIVVVLPLLIVYLWQESPEAPLPWPTADAIGGIITSHNNWEEVYGLGNRYKCLPQTIKNYETTMTHMRVAIKHSDMGNREGLEQGMEAFSLGIDELISKLVAWDSLAQATVEEIQNLSDYTARSTPGWAADDFLDLRTRRNRQLHHLLDQEGRKIVGRLDYLKEEEPSLLGGSNMAGVHLRTIAEFLRDEVASLDPEGGQFAKRACSLDKMLEVVVGGHRMINNLQVTVKKSGAGLERLRQAIMGIGYKTGCETREMSLYLDNIQHAIDSLGDVWKPHRSGSQSRGSIKEGGE